MKSRTDTLTHNGGASISKYDYYLVEGYSKASAVESQIDSFVCQRVRKIEDLDSIYHYFIFFFKKTRKTNPEYLADHPKSFWRHSITHDRLFTYKWIRGTFVSKESDFKGQYPARREGELMCDEQESPDK